MAVLSLFDHKSFDADALNMINLFSCQAQVAVPSDEDNDKIKAWGVSAERHRSPALYTFFIHLMHTCPEMWTDCFLLISSAAHGSFWDLLFLLFWCQVFIWSENTMQNIKQMLHAEQGQLSFKITLMPETNVLQLHTEQDSLFPLDILKGYSLQNELDLINGFCWTGANYVLIEGHNARLIERSCDDFFFLSRCAFKGLREWAAFSLMSRVQSRSKFPQC